MFDVAALERSSAVDERIGAALPALPTTCRARRETRLIRWSMVPNIGRRSGPVLERNVEVHSWTRRQLHTIEILEVGPDILAGQKLLVGQTSR